MLDPGTTISHYRILRTLGAGGMGEVYLARDTTLEREVAIKILPAEMASDPDRLRRFIQEAKAASAIQHPNVALIHELGNWEGQHFIVMEYIEGETLETNLKTGPLEIPRLIDLAIQIADALEEAHSKKIIHRDLKPSNIAITSRGEIKVLDFGLAKIVRSADATTDLSTVTSTQAGRVVGTVPYMSPEQLLGKGLDSRTDIFSGGIILYQMCTGRLPFSGATAVETFHLIAHEQPEAIARYNHKAPAELERIVGKCLEKDPARRYQSAKELFTDLNNLKRDLESTKGSKSKRSTRKSSRVIESLAVLPFLNQSNERELDYLSDGITESLINSLSQIPRLRVVSRATVFRFKSKEMDLHQIGKELDVHALLTGRVMQRENNLNIRTELMHVDQDAQIWGEQYNRTLSDIFVLQEEIAREIASQLKLRLTGEEKKKLARRFTQNTDAYHLYLKGRYFWNRRTAASLQKGLGYFQRALQIDPTYALAYGGIADTYLALTSSCELPPGEAVPKARIALAKALEIEQTVPELYSCMAYINALHDWDWASAEKNFKQSIELNPAYADAYHWYSHFLVMQKRFHESWQASKRLMELDPLNLTYHAHMGWHFWCTGQYDSGIQQLRSAMEMDPSFVFLHFYLARCYEQNGMMPEAIAEFEKAAQLSPDPEKLAGLGHAYARAGDKENAIHFLEELKILEKERYVSPCYFALLCQVIDENDWAFDWLEKAFSNHDAELVYFGVDPRLENLRSDARGRDLLRRIGLP